jgi:hypothetical protein
MATCAGPQQHEIFGLGNQAGLSTWLQNGGAAPLQASGVDGLQVLVAGPTAGNPVALLSTQRLAERLAELRGQAGYVLIDAPPVLAVTDAALWASQVDGVVLLINAGATKREQAQRARRCWPASRRRFSAQCCSTRRRPLRPAHTRSSEGNTLTQRRGDAQRFLFFLCEPLRRCVSASKQLFVSI